MRRMSDAPGIDEKTARALRALEDKVEELDVRLRDAERRLAAGGL